ncbi:MAG: hypothetical protein AB7F35_01120 [Acetobacteraceae bacterium]
MHAVAESILGHNNPPTEAEIIRDRLADTHKAALAKADELIAAVSRVPATCEDEDTAGKISDLVKMLSAQHKTVEAARVQEKEPHLAAGRAVDGFFKAVTERLAVAKATAEKPLDAFVKAQAEAERKRRAEEAERLRLEAEAKAAEAEAMAGNNVKASDAMLTFAAHTEQQAAKLEEARPADLAKTRGSIGSVASLRTRWVGEVTNAAALDLEKLRPHFSADALQKALNAYVAAGGRELTGASIYEKSDTVVR